jgi:16S rRNA (adenine1518-N6/adenine1519-N6)-dimethyltransferase
MNTSFPIKRFGQNYLRDENIINKIVSEISPKPNDLILEIGPGEGALTAKLLEKSNKLIAVEIDKRNVEMLSINFPNLNLVSGDFLDIDLKNFIDPASKKLRIVGNIPYNITSPIIFKMIENKELIQDSVLMVQHEVAQRIIAKPASKDYGILSVIVQYFAEVILCFKVSPNVFYPRPKVFSAVIHLNFKDCLKNSKEDEMFIKVVKAAFGNRRKMLNNSFKNSIFGHLNFNNSGIDLTLRAERLSIDDFIILTKFVSEQIDKEYPEKSK